MQSRTNAGFNSHVSPKDLLDVKTDYNTFMKFKQIKETKKQKPKPVYMEVTQVESTTFGPPAREGA